MENPGDFPPTAKYSLWFGFLMGFGFAVYLGYKPQTTTEAPDTPPLADQSANDPKRAPASKKKESQE